MRLEGLGLRLGRPLRLWEGKVGGMSVDMYRMSLDGKYWPWSRRCSVKLMQAGGCLGLCVLPNASLECWGGGRVPPTKVSHGCSSTTLSPAAFMCARRLWHRHLPLSPPPAPSRHPCSPLAPTQAVEPGSVVLEVGGMTCASCVASLEGALKAVPGVLEVTVNLMTAQVGRALWAGRAVSGASQPRSFCWQQSGGAVRG